MVLILRPRSNNHQFNHQLCFVDGRNTVIIPINGKKEQTPNTYSTLVSSARLPSTAEPRPPIPNARPKKSPAISPTFPGTSSVAYTSIAENAEEMMSPITMDNATVRPKET